MYRREEFVEGSGRERLKLVKPLGDDQGKLIQEKVQQEEMDGDSARGVSKKRWSELEIGVNGK